MKIKLLLCSLLFSSTVFAVDVPITTFSMKNYSQSVNKWFDPASPDYNQPLISATYQQQRVKEFYSHDFSTKKNASSPWSRGYIETIFHQDPDLKTLENNLVDWFSNKGKDPAHIGYGENFRAYNAAWIASIQDNMNINQFSSLKYSKKNRAIAVNNIDARVLPTDDPHFYHFTLAGQGFPFDNLQMSSIWAGTPLYIIAQSKDKAWDYVATPSVIAWVHSDDIARVKDRFVNTWAQAAKNKMAVTIHTQTSIENKRGDFKFYAYVGSVFPLVKVNKNKLTVLIPTKKKNGYAAIEKVQVDNQQLAPMPLPATRHQFSRVVASLLNRPYGWGGYHFYNDCSQELKSLYAAFGIWLPRHSSNQLDAGKMTDESALGLKHRLNYLMKNGHPLMSIIYIGGHVIMYLGNYKNPYAPGQQMAMTYQNLWGLSPASKDRRAVIGESVLFPLLKHYPQDPSLTSLAGKTYFKIADLDAWPAASLKAARHFDLKSLVYPGSIK